MEVLDPLALDVVYPLGDVVQQSPSVAPPTPTVKQFNNTKRTLEALTKDTTKDTTTTALKRLKSAIENFIKGGKID